LAILSDCNATDFLGVTAGSVESDNALAIRDAVEAWLQKYCNRTFESTTYTLEKYNGTGTKYLYLRQTPVTALYRVATSTTDVIRIKNTSEYTTASVSVTSTGIVLEKDGSTNTTALFATYTTMTALATAISAISGWSASVASSTYNSYKSSNLLKVYGLNCIDSNEVYLRMPDDALDDIELNENNGMIYSSSGFPKGFNNIYVTYVAGYTSASMPADLVFAVKVFLKSIYDKFTAGSWNVRGYRIGDISMYLNDGNVEIPRETEEILARYRRIRV